MSVLTLRQSSVSVGSLKNLKDHPLVQLTSVSATEPLSSSEPVLAALSAASELGLE